MKTHNAENLRKGFEKAKFLDYENGMATYPVKIEREFEKVKIIRKCGNLERPEIYLLIIEPNKDAGYIAPNLENLNKGLKQALDLYGDIRFTFKKRRNSRDKEIYDLIIDEKLV